MIMNTKKGFTLIELLTVTAIITLLMSMVFFKVTEAKKKGEDAHMKAESSQVARAVYQYKEDNNGKVPGHEGITVTGTGFETYVEGDPITGEEYTAAMQELVTGGYLSEIPTSPAGGDYSYIISADGDDAVFATDLNYENSSGGERNSCEMTEDDSGSSCTPPGTAPWYGGSGYNYHTIPATGSIQGSCTSGGLYGYATGNGFACISRTPAIRDARCNCANSTPINPAITPPQACGLACSGGTNPKAGLWSINGYAGYYNYQQQLLAYNQVVAEYAACIALEESNAICDGSESTDYCTCM